MNLDSLIGEALIHVNGNAAGQSTSPVEADPGTVLLAYARALEQGDGPAADGVLEFLNSKSTFADGLLSTFAAWRPYTDPKTGRTGFISEGGLVRYKDMRKADEPSAADPAKLLADPDKIGDEHLPALRAHLESLPPDQLAAAAKELVGKATPEELQAADDFFRQRGGKTGSLIDWAASVKKEEAKPKEPEKKPESGPGKFTNTPGTGERVKMDHIDPSHPIAKAISTDRHVQEVFSKIGPHLDKLKTHYEARDAAYKENLKAAEDGYALAESHEKLKVKYKDVVSGNWPKYGTKARDRWDTRAAKYHKEVEKINKDEADHYDKVIKPAREKAKAAKAAVEKAEAEAAPAVLDALMPDKPIHVNGAFEPPAGQSWYEHPDNEKFKAVPALFAATREEWDNASMFVKAVCGHQRTLDLVYGVSGSGRGFAHEEKAGPSTVTVSREVTHNDARTYTRSVAVHEIGHIIENKSPGLADDSKEFVNYRCGNEPVVALNDALGGGYMDHEYGRKDKFDRAFDGSESSAYYVGKVYGSNSSEVISMGIQLLHDNPVQFAAKDPEYFAFMVRSLRRDA